MSAKAKSKEIDILHGALIPNLIRFAIPIALTGILQQLFHFADTAVVGRFANANALAAVGTNGEIVALIVSISAGIAVGVNVRIAAAIGKREKEVIPSVIKTAWMIALISGFLIMAVTEILSQSILRLINTPENILDEAILYLRLYAIGCPALMFYDFNSAVLRAHGDSRRPLTVMMISGIINLLLNLFFVIVLGIGVAGVALATDISGVFSALITFQWVRELFKEERRSARIVSAEAAAMLRIGIPAAIQGAVFCFANIFVQSAVNTFGATVTAGAAAAMNFEYLTYYAITAFGQTAATFTGQNYAAGNYERCRRIGVMCVVLSAISCGLLTTPLVIFRYQAAAFFSGDAAVIEAAAVRMLVILTFEPICACYESLSGILRGMGQSMLPAAETIIGTCLLRIIWIQTVFVRFHKQEILYVVFPISWVVTSLIVWITYTYFRKKVLQNVLKTVYAD